jgi:hypothetical protein
VIKLRGPVWATTVLHGLCAANRAYTIGCRGVLSWRVPRDRYDTRRWGIE